MPQRFQKRNNVVQLCKKDVCLNAKGEYAELIAIAAAFAIICSGIAYLANIK